MSDQVAIHVDFMEALYSLDGNADLEGHIFKRGPLSLMDAFAYHYRKNPSQVRLDLEFFQQCVGRMCVTTDIGELGIQFVGSARNVVILRRSER